MAEPSRAWGRKGGGEIVGNIWGVRKLGPSLGSSGSWILKLTHNEQYGTFKIQDFKI